MFSVSVTFCFFDPGFGLKGINGAGRIHSGTSVLFLYRSAFDRSSRSEQHEISDQTEDEASVQVARGAAPRQQEAADL